MPQSTDVELAGAGYMLAPGTYKRTVDASAGGQRQTHAAPGAARRVAVEDFAGGQRQALGRTADGHPSRGWDAVGVGPAYGGQAK